MNNDVIEMISKTSDIYTQIKMKLMNKYYNTLIVIKKFLQTEYIKEINWKKINECGWLKVESDNSQDDSALGLLFYDIYYWLCKKDRSSYWIYSCEDFGEYYCYPEIFNSEYCAKKYRCPCKEIRTYPYYNINDLKNI